MTDNEIIKALECLISEDCLGEQCPYFAMGMDCAKQMPKDVYDFINRQKAEIERLKDELAQTEDAFNKIYEINGAYERKIDTIKSEAIKEIAERLEDLSTERLLYEGYGETKLENIIICTDIDNLLKEMVGEEDA